jgi:hypothetical protein
MIEEWKTIPRYPHCEVSNTGRVRYKEEFYEHCHGLTSRERPYKLGGFGYLQVNLIPEDRSTYGNTESVHNLVAEAFIGPRPDKGYRVDHKNEDKLNNGPDNLQWLVHGHNTIKAQNVGERRYFYEGELWLIKKLLAAHIPYKMIGKMFKCSTMLISDVRKGLKDHHIKLPNGSLSW